MRNRGMYLVLALVAVTVSALMAVPVQGGEGESFTMYNHQFTYGELNQIIACNLHSTQKDEPIDPPGECDGGDTWKEVGCKSVTGTAHSEALEGHVPSIEHPEDEGEPCGGGIG